MGIIFFLYTTHLFRGKEGVFKSPAHWEETDQKHVINHIVLLGQSCLSRDPILSGLMVCLLIQGKTIVAANCEGKRSTPKSTFQAQLSVVTVGVLLNSFVIQEGWKISMFSNCFDWLDFCSLFVFLILQQDIYLDSPAICCNPPLK